MYRSRGRGRRGGGGYNGSSSNNYGGPARQDLYPANEPNYGPSYTRSYVSPRESSGYVEGVRDYPRNDARNDYGVNRPFFGSSNVRNSRPPTRPPPRQVPPRQVGRPAPYNRTRQVYEDEGSYSRASGQRRNPAPEPVRPRRPREFHQDNYHSRKRPPQAIESRHPRKRRDTRPPPTKPRPVSKRGPAPVKRAPKRIDKLPPRSVPKRSEKKKTGKPKDSVVKTKKVEEKKKHVTHDMKLRSVIFASGIPGKDEQHDFLVSRNHNHPAIGCIPRVKLGENEWYFVLEVSEHEKDRRRKYSRSSNRGICRWKLLKNDITSIRTFEGFSVTDPGPVLDFSNLQSTIIDGTKDVPISIDDSDGPEESEKPKEKATEKQDDDSPPTESIVVTAVAGTEEPAVVVTAVEEDEEEVVEEMAEEPDEDEEPDPLDPDTLESLKVTELREKCKGRDLYAKGLKRELVSRLREYLTEKAKRLEQKSKQAEDTENTDIFPDANDDEDDDDDVIVEEPEKPAEKEETEKSDEKMEDTENPAEKEDEDNVLSGEEAEEVVEADNAEGENAPQEGATEEAAAGDQQQQQEGMEVETEAQEEDPDQEVELALIDVETVADKLSGICSVINDVQNEGSAYWFVPDLTSVDSWQGSEEELKHYLEKIESPMSFTQVKVQVEDGTLDTEEKLIAAVNQILKNAREFNEEGSEWFVNAQNVENDFKRRLDNLETERKLSTVDENGKLKFSEMPPELLKRILQDAEVSSSENDPEALAKLVEKAVTKLQEKTEGLDAKDVVISSHRALIEEAEKLARDPSSRNNAFYVAMSFNHELRQIHHDRDIISSSHTDKTRMLIFEFRKDISSKLDAIKSHWLKMMKEGPAKGIEKKNVFGEDGAEFEALMTKLVTNSNEYYKKEKRFATNEELISSNKKLRSDKEGLEKRLKDKSDENRGLKKLLDEIYRLSDYRKLHKGKSSSSRA